MSSGATPSRAISRSTSAATACACARSFAQRQKRDLAAGSRRRLQRLGDAVLDRLDDGARGGEDPLRAAEALLQPHDRRRRPLGLEVAQVLGRRAAEAVDRLVVVAGGADVAVLGGEQPQQQALGEVRVLQLVDEHVAVARGDPRAHVRAARAAARNASQDEVAEVERPGLGEHAVVGARRSRRTRARAPARRGRVRAASPPTRA